MLKRRELLIRSGIGATAVLLGSVGSRAAATPAEREAVALLVSSTTPSRQFADAFTSASGHLALQEWSYQSGSAYLAELCTSVAPSIGPSLAPSRSQGKPQYLGGLVSRGDWEIIDMMLPHRARLHELGLPSSADPEHFKAAGVALARQRPNLAAAANASQLRSLGAASYVAFLYLI